MSKDVYGSYGAGLGRRYGLKAVNYAMEVCQTRSTSASTQVTEKAIQFAEAELSEVKLACITIAGANSVNTSLVSYDIPALHESR